MTRYQAFKEAGLCPWCHKLVDRDGVYCQSCLEEHRRYNDFATKRRKANRKDGLCSCGAETDGIHKMCRLCRKIHNEQMKRYFAKRKEATA